MRSYHAHRTRLMTTMQASFTRSILGKVLNLRVHQKRCGGDVYGNLTYSLFELMTPVQHEQFRLKLTRHCVETLFTDSFVTTLLLACFEPTGQPRKESKLLYEWLLQNVYSSNVTHMLEDWLAVKLPQPSKAMP